MKHENKLSGFTIRGFKSIAYDKPVSVELGDVNIMLGANGAGKSNIISFFKILDQMMKGALQLYIAKSGTNQNFLYYGSKKTPSFDAEICVDTDKYIYLYKS